METIRIKDTTMELGDGSRKRKL